MSFKVFEKLIFISIVSLLMSGCVFMQKEVVLLNGEAIPAIANEKPLKGVTVDVEFLGSLASIKDPYVEPINFVLDHYGASRHQKRQVPKVGDYKIYFDLVEQNITEVNFLRMLLTSFTFGLVSTQSGVHEVSLKTKIRKKEIDGIFDVGEEKIIIGTEKLKAGIAYFNDSLSKYKYGKYTVYIFNNSDYIHYMPTIQVALVDALEDVTSDIKKSTNK